MDFLFKYLVGVWNPRTRETSLAQLWRPCLLLCPWWPATSGWRQKPLGPSGATGAVGKQLLSGVSNGLTWAPWILSASVSPVCDPDALLFSRATPFTSGFLSSWPIACALRSTHPEHCWATFSLLTQICFLQLSLPPLPYPKISVYDLCSEERILPILCPFWRYSLFLLVYVSDPDRYYN